MIVSDKVYCWFDAAIKRGFFLVCLLLSCLIYGQQPSFFSFAEREFEGIDIYDVIQDHQDVYWFATDQGIFRHDGYSFRKLECDEMKSNSVFNFVIDAKGTIYCNNLNFQIFTIRDNRCELFMDVKHLELSNDLSLEIVDRNHLMISSVKVFVFDENRKMIAASENIPSVIGEPFKLEDGSVIMDIPYEKVALRYHKGKFIRYALPRNGKKKSITSLQFYKLGNQTYAIDRFSKVIYLFDEKTITIKKCGVLPEYIQNESLRYYEGQDCLWIASSLSGLLIMGSDGKLTYGTHKLYSDYFISDVFVDHEKNILLSTFDKGILVIPEIDIPDVLPEVTGKKITRISENPIHGKYYLGTADGEVIEAANGTFKEIIKNGSKVIETIYYWQKQDLLFNDDRGLSVFDPRSGKQQALGLGSLKDITEVDDHHLIMAFNIGIRKLRYDPVNRQFELGHRYTVLRTNRVHFDQESKVLYAATSEGLKLFHENGKVQDITLAGKSLFVTDFLMVDGKLMAATRRNGILTLKEGKIIKRILPKQNSEVLNLYQLSWSGNRFYANTDQGLLILNQKGKVLMQLNKAIGISSNRVIDFRVDQGMIWLAQTRGLQCIPLKKLNSKRLIPPFRIETIKVNDSGNFKFKHAFASDQHKFTFVLRAISLKLRENLQYRYKLDGNDVNWSTASYSDHVVTYNALAPGTYTFRAQVVNNGLSGDLMVYRFIIYPPIHQTWWFRTLAVLIIFVVMLLIFRRILIVRRRKSEQVNELLSSKLTALKAQMNPHFIFNALNSIQALVLSGDSDNSYRFITRFSKLIRNTLVNSDREFIDFSQEMEQLEHYLSLENLRLGGQLKLHLEVPETISDIEIPPMLIQPFIENALIHGLLHKEGEKELSIRFWLDEVLHCVIEDNGIGRIKASEIKKRQRNEHVSFSVEATRRRLSLLQKQFGDQFGYVYHDLKDEQGEALGTRVHLSIPVKHKF